SNQTIDRINPAAWSRINRTRFSAGGMYEGFSSSDSSGSSYLSKTHFNGLSLAIPIERDEGIVLSAGVAPYTKVNYNIVSAFTQGSLSYVLRYLGEGGLSLAHLGMSGSLSSELHLGAKLDYYFGSINHTVSQTFTTTQFTSAEVVRATRFSGAGVTMGVLYSGLRNALNLGEGNALNIAATFSTASSLTTTEERFSTYNSGSVISRDTTTSPDGKLQLPLGLSIGLAYQSDRITVAADFAYQKWGDLTSNGVSSPEIRDSYRIGGGLEFIPKKDPAAPFTQRMAYRFGLFYNASYYEIRGEKINEAGVTGGIGFPLFGDTRVNISGEYGFRGTTDFQLQKDKILRISFTLDISELWFVRPPEE
ncbi:MAG TPA: hypothetical protein VGR15_10825, partial [Bacteroidota bacterium]|nr:hypothetical protein [Bacteroidota bacterium]